MAGHNDDTNDNAPKISQETAHLPVDNTPMPEIDEDGMDDFAPTNLGGRSAAHEGVGDGTPTPEDEQFLNSIFLSDEEMEQQDRAEREMRLTKKGTPRKYRPGRLPLYYRHEVERIRADPRSDVLMAEAEGVSPVTIARVRQHGIYKNIPYIARDEINREAQAMGLQSHMSHMHPSYIAKSLGRPFQSGRAKPSDDERKAIAYDTREAGEVAKAFGVSRSFVYKMRAEFKVRWVRVDPLTPFQREKFEALKHTKDVEALSRALNLPALVVQALLDGEFAQPVTNGGNDGADE